MAGQCWLLHASNWFLSKQSSLTWNASWTDSSPNILKYQLKDNQLRQDALKKKGLAKRIFHGGRKSYSLICYKNKICVLSTLQKWTVQWYHTYLCHPSKTCTKETIQQHLWWPKLCEHITTYCKTCHICQLNKSQSKKYGHLPEKDAEATPPWDRLWTLYLVGCW